jgi:hypothetical protein
MQWKSVSERSIPLNHQQLDFVSGQRNILFGNTLGNCPARVGTLAPTLKILRSSQKGLVGIEYDLPCSKRRGQVEAGLRPVSEYLA